jgi:hypothetical protein
MNAIEKMLTGQMEMKEFVQLLKNDENLQEAVRHLIPRELETNRNHPFWKTYSYDALEKCQFDFLKHMCKFIKFNNSIGDNLNIWGTIGHIYGFLHPELQFTSKYMEEHSLYLDVAAEYYEGVEVRDYIEAIIRENISITPKTKRIKETKAKLAELFHVTDRKRPYWIQGAEWPAGKNSPMKYLNKKKISDGMVYVFSDVDTGEVREIIQYY